MAHIHRCLLLLLLFIWSERAASGFYCKKQLKEGSNINKSLVSLGNVISILGTCFVCQVYFQILTFSRTRTSFAFLAENTQRAFSVSNLNINTTGLNTTFNSSTAESTAETKTESKLFIPYRDSMLTYLLKDSLGGNSQTHMIASKRSIQSIKTLNPGVSICPRAKWFKWKKLVW